MKKVGLVMCYCFSFFWLAAQQAEPLIFKEKSFDFGEVIEEDGNANHEFIFTNTSGRPVSIVAVQASCGCTTPGWTKQPIAPGKTGSVLASFDPKGRPGYFNKTLSVTTSLGANPILLEIKGEVVISKREPTATEFPVKNGNLRMKAGSFNMGKVFINRDAPKKEFAVYNEGTTPIHFLKSVGPAYIKTELPEVVDPGKKGTIKIIYNGKARNQYGFVSDNVELTTDDGLVPIKSFSVYATVEEFFPTRNAAELTRVPVLSMDVATLDMGQVRLGASVQRQVVLKNTGKEELIIRALQENCPCVTAKIGSQKLKAGEETTLDIAFTAQGRGGTQQKALTIYSTDPQNPVQRIAITAYVEE